MTYKIGILEMINNGNGDIRVVVISWDDVLDDSGRSDISIAKLIINAYQSLLITITFVNVVSIL